MDVRNKKATFLISSLAGGGAEGVCVNIANGLAGKGWQIDLVVLHLNNAVYADRLSSKVNLVVLGVARARNAFLPLRKYLQKSGTQQLVVFNYDMTVIAVLARKTLAKKFRLISRNINTISQQKGSAKGFWAKCVVRPLVDRYFQQADMIINQCKAMKDDLVAVYPKVKDKVTVIYNPVNAKIINSDIDLNKQALLSQQDFLLCIGRLEPQKGFDRAIEAFAQIHHNHSGLRLKILGQGSLIDSLKQKAQQLGVSERIDFLGFESDTKPYYMLAKLFLLFSRYEGFPNVVVESLSLGTPVVAFDCPSGPSELILSAKNGYLVKNSDVDDFATKITMGLEQVWDKSLIINSVSHLRLDNIVEQWESLLVDSSKGFEPKGAQ